MLSGGMASYLNGAKITSDANGDWIHSLIIRVLRMLLLILEDSKMNSNAILQSLDFVFWTVVLIFIIFIPIAIKLTRSKPWTQAITKTSFLTRMLGMVNHWHGAYRITKASFLAGMVNRWHGVSRITKISFLAGMLGGVFLFVHTSIILYDSDILPKEDLLILKYMFDITSSQLKNYSSIGIILIFGTVIVIDAINKRDIFTSERAARFTLSMLLIIFIGIMLSPPIEAIFLDWLGTKKHEALEFVGLGMAGMLAVINAIAIHNYVTGQEEKHARQQINDAKRSLASSNESMRNFGFSQLCELANNNQNINDTKNIYNTLCIHIRSMTHDENKPPTKECQASLDMLFSPENEFMSDVFQINFQRINLSGADIKNANLVNSKFAHAKLERADLTRADLKGANFVYANLAHAILEKANLEETNFTNADLESANLVGTNLANANLTYASLCKASLFTANLTKANLDNANFQGADLRKTNLIKGNLEYACLAYATLTDADIRNATLTGADCARANFSNANLSRVNLSDANLFHANLSKAKLLSTNLSGVKLSDADISDANLSYANLSDANLSDSNLSGAIFFRTNLAGADISDANLSRTFFLEGNLSGVNLSNTNFSVANLTDANLSGANLSGANLLDANLQRAQLKDTKLQHVSSIEGADFRNAKIGDRPITKDDIPANKGKYYADWNPPSEKEKNKNKDPRFIRMDYGN